MSTMTESRDLKHTERIFKALQTIKKINPDLRIGQIFNNAVTKDIFYVEDDDLATALEKYIGATTWRK